MHKDFDEWNVLKKDIHTIFNHRFYRERQIWWCSVGRNVGFEENGKGDQFIRPMLVIKGFSKELCLCLPITTKNKKGVYYYPLNLSDNKDRFVILSQLKTIDTKRLLKKVGILDSDQYTKIKQAIIDMLK
ncbi:type II toxin-antitoxin system PemK/MazF family toxin [Candidatus Nomurabacteria bacterium]|nr:type II toxin-antitoxin system PemK/MazF family toxin [Candidatus Nomurabacteria bacterium]